MITINLRLFEILVICAVRYAIGRCSTMPSTVVDEVVLPYLSQLRDGTIRCILEDLKERQRMEEFHGLSVWGMECDYQTWHYLWRALEEETKRRGMR